MTADITLNEIKQDKGLLEKTANALGIKSSNVVGSADYKKMQLARQSGGDVYAEWNSTDSLYNELVAKARTYRSYYLGEDYEQGVSNLEGNIKVAVNLGATFVDLFTYILTNNPPEIQFVADADPMSQTEANYKEALTSRLLADCHFHKRFRDGAKTNALVGYVFLYPFWNKDNKDGGEKGTFDLSILNPFTTRVKFKADDIEQIESFITQSRLTPAEVLKRYDFEALPDNYYSNDISYPQTFLAEDDDKVTVLHRCGDKDIRIVINGQEVERIEHNLGFCPLVPVNNIGVLNDIHGHSEIARWLALAQEINALLSAISEVSRDLAYPPILEYNNALGGQTPKKWRAMKIPAKRSDRGEGVEYLVNSAQIAPMIEQVKLLIDLLHFVALMPKAAGGIFPANVTSGFQAKLSMQSATLTTDNRKIDWEWAIMQLVKMAFKMVRHYDPSALSIKTDQGKIVEISDVAPHEMKVVWPENLPIDVAREIQNLVMGLTNNMTSLHQAIDRYNVLMGLDSPDNTIDFLKQEADDPRLGPERALKVRNVQLQITQILQQLQSMNQQMEANRSQMNGGSNSVPENMDMGGSMTGQPGMNANNLGKQTQPASAKKPYPPTAREAIVPESAGGQVVPPTGGM